MRALLVLLAFLISAPAAAEPVRVAVAQDKDGFIADFTLPADAPAWGFWRSSTAVAWASSRDIGASPPLNSRRIAVLRAIRSRSVSHGDERPARTLGER